MHAECETCEIQRRQWQQRTLLSSVTSTASIPMLISTSDSNSVRAFADARKHFGHWQLSLSQVNGYWLWPPSSHSTSTSLSSLRARTCLTAWRPWGVDEEPSVCCPRSCTDGREKNRGPAAWTGKRQALRAWQAIAEVLLCRAGQTKRENLLIHIFEWLPRLVSQRRLQICRKRETKVRLSCTSVRWCIKKKIWTIN